MNLKPLTLATSAALAVALSLGACKRDEPVTTTTPTPAPTTTPAPAPAPAATVYVRAPVLPPPACPIGCSVERTVESTLRKSGPGVVFTLRKSAPVAPLCVLDVREKSGRIEPPDAPVPDCVVRLFTSEKSGFGLRPRRMSRKLRAMSALLLHSESHLARGANQHRANGAGRAFSQPCPVRRAKAA